MDMSILSTTAIITSVVSSVIAFEAGRKYHIAKQREAGRLRQLWIKELTPDPTPTPTPTPAPTPIEVLPVRTQEKPKRRGKRRFPVRMAAKLYNSGMSVQQVAKVVGWSYPTTRQRLKSVIALRRRGRPEGVSVK